MSSRSDTRSVVTVTPDMDSAARRAAIEGLAAGIRTVEMPASWELLHGQAVLSDDQRRSLGTVTFEARAGRVYAVRKAAGLRRPGGIYGGGPGVRRYPVEFSGDVDPADRVVRGTVTSELTRYNRMIYPLAAFAGILIGLGLAVATGHVWTIVLFAPLAIAVLLALRLVTPRREARVMVSDLQRIAVLAAGKRPRLTDSRRRRP